MFPNPNDWLLVKALEDAHTRNARNQRRCSMPKRLWSPADETFTYLFDRFRQWVNEIQATMRPEEECNCLGCCQTAGVPAI
jgi:hypothetical protein